MFFSNSQEHGGLAAAGCQHHALIDQQKFSLLSQAGQDFLLARLKP